MPAKPLLVLQVKPVFRLLAQSRSIIITTTRKGITIDSTLCTTPRASITNISDTSGTMTTFSTDGTAAIANGITVSTTCAEENPDVPETLDAVYVYALIFVASSAIFVYRRHLAKR